MRLHNRLICISLLGFLVACGSAPMASDAGDRAHADKVHADRATAQQAAKYARSMVGKPYRYGGNSPGGFDCSGLVQYSYSRAGYSTPRTTGQLWSAVKTVDRHQLRAGDLLFFSIEGKMSHVGLYVGERRFVHAPQTGRSVSIESLDAPFYKAAFIRAGRLY